MQSVAFGPTVWWVCLFCQSLVAVILVIAAITKVVNKVAFSAIVGNYELLPRRWVSAIASTIIVYEFLTALLLLSGRVPGVASLGVAALFAVFAGGMAINMVRGRNHIACGCFGESEKIHISWALVIRNTGLSLWMLASNPRIWSDDSNPVTIPQEAVVISLAVMAVACYWFVSTAVTVLRQAGSATEVSG